MFSSNPEIIRRKVIKVRSVRKVSPLVHVDAALGLAEEAGRHLRRVLALRREMVCP
jgi:hypothetical protein